MWEPLSFSEAGAAVWQAFPGDPIAASPGLDSSHNLIRLPTRVYAVATVTCRDALKNRNNATSGNALPTSITPSQPPCS